MRDPGVIPVSLRHHMWPARTRPVIRHVLPCLHDDVIKRKHFPRYWPLVRGIHRSVVNSPHRGQWRGGLMLSLISAWINGWVNNREAGDLRRHRAHYDVTVMDKRQSDKCGNSRKQQSSHVKSTNALCWNRRPDRIPRWRHNETESVDFTCCVHKVRPMLEIDTK